MKKKTARGGRKPLGRTKVLISLAPATLEELRRRAEAQKVPLGYVLDGLLAPEGRTA